MTGMSTPTPDLPLTWHAPKRRMIAFGGLGILMTALSGFCIFIGGIIGIAIGAFGVLFFGACTVLIFASALNPKPVLAVTERGIDIWRHPFISWEELTAIEVSTSAGEVFLVFDVTDPDAYVARMSPISRRLAKMNQTLMPGVAFLSARTLPEPVKEVARKIGAVHPHNR